jgi:hypothetical protein
MKPFVFILMFLLGGCVIPDFTDTEQAVQGEDEVDERACFSETCEQRKPASSSRHAGENSTGQDINRGSSAVLPEEYYQ